ncbi:RAI1-domain-containing protein [Auriscalpium vulgare]|uniref:RAI1-domain-containing protein n=1 Tax=Auriscalpium vulgare TaxID=40419 RepID=A0ACB8S7Z8_9AGAM|nr:RAI1-domain-containing protein [Auriscalpium vulgare]
MSSRKRSIAEVLDNTEQEGPRHTRARRSTSPTHNDTRPGSPIALSYTPTTQAASRAVPFQQPAPLLTFSYDDSHTLEFTNAAMRYYVEPPPRAELSYGYERWVRRPDERGRLDSLLRAYTKVRAQGVVGAAGAEIGVVSWRGVMTRILTAPYENRDGWEMNVMLCDGTLYFEEHLTEARLQEKNNMPSHQRTQTYYGYSFESWCAASEPRAVPGWHGDVNTNVQWCSLVKTKLGATRLVIGGEVDCVRDRYDGRNDTMVELKTSMNIRGPQDEQRFEKKLLKFYFQSFLLGVPEIIVGFRTPKGQLTTLQSFKTMQIPRMIRGKPDSWDPQICLLWGDEFVTWLRQTLASWAGSGGPERVWRVKFAPGVGVEIVMLNDAETKDVGGGEERVGFLPSWYWKEIYQRGEDDVKSDPGSASAGTSDKLSSANTRLPASLPTGWQI